jgi:hypothetical protein
MASYQNYYGGNYGSGGSGSSGNGATGYNAFSSNNRYGMPQYSRMADKTEFSGPLHEGASRAQDTYDWGYNTSRGDFIDPNRQKTAWSQDAAQNYFGGNGMAARTQAMQDVNASNEAVYGNMFDRQRQRAATALNAQGAGGSGAAQIADSRVMADMTSELQDKYAQGVMGQQAVNVGYDKMGVDTTNQFSDWKATTHYNEGQQESQLMMSKYMADQAAKAAKAQSQSNMFGSLLGLGGKLLSGGFL